MTKQQPPHNKDAEKAVLGSILVSPGVLLEVRNILQPDDFFINVHGIVWNAMCKLADQGDPPDVLLVDQALAGVDYGGPAYLTELITHIPSTLNAVHYAEIVHNMGTRRRLLNAASTTARRAMDVKKEIGEVVSESQSDMMEATINGSGRRGPVEMKAALEEHYDVTMSVQNGTITPVPSGLKDYDKILVGGWKPTTLNIIAARTGLGKTATMCTAAANVAFAGYVPLIFSAEQPTSQIITRLIADKAKISIDVFDQKDGLSDAMMQQWGAAIGELEKVKLYIDDTPGPSVTYITNEMRRLRIQASIDIVFIDYLQLIRPAKESRMRYLEIQDVLEHLHRAARELEIPVVLTAQIGREVDVRQGHRPVMKDLRESGDIENFAYTITFLHRDDFFDPNAINKNIAELIVAKHRQGPTGVASVIWRGKYSRLENAVIQTIDLTKSQPSTTVPVVPAVPGSTMSPVVTPPPPVQEIMI
jgi:replicative DNA helicase